MPTTDHGLTYWTRQEWGAAHGQGPVRSPKHPVDLVVVHHTWEPTLACGQERALEVTLVRRIERFHVVERRPPLGRIGYTFLCFQSGRVYEGVGWKRIGAHCGGHNTRALGWCFVLNGDVEDPSPAAVESFRAFLAAAPEMEEMAADFEVRGHRDFRSTSCPGDRVYEAIVQAMKTDTPTLRRGNRGPDVERLQRLLARTGATLDVDGIFGARTEDAVREYQAGNRLEVDGVVGPATWEALLR